jgi:hypothetical protein
MQQNYSLPRVLALASQGVQQSLADIGLPGNTEMGAAVQEALKDKRATALKDAASDIVAIMEKVEAFCTKQLLEAEELFKQAEAKKALATDASKALSYGMSTQNFVPALVQIGDPVGPVSNDLKKVPKDWVQPASAPAAPTPANAGPATPS